MQPPQHQPPANGQTGAPPPPVSGAPQLGPPPPYYQQPGPPPPPHYYQPPPPPPPAMWGQPPPPPHYAPPPPQHYAPPPPPPHYAAPPQHYAAPPQHYAPPQYGAAPGGEEVRSLWVGDLQYWMDENYLYHAFAHMAQQIASVKIIRNKQTGNSEGYGFIEFHSRAAAEHTLMNFNGRMMPHVDTAFKLNWASASAGNKRGDDSSDHTIFVGDLAADVTDSMLQEIFKASYPSVRGAKVVTDRLTGRSKGYGFVHFGDINEQTRAMTEMNGTMLSTRQMRIGPAGNKKNMGVQQTYATNGAHESSQGDSENDPNNTTVFVGGLDSNINEEYLRQVFSPYGEIGYVKIPVGKRCGFVQFSSRSSAEEAIRMLNGTQIGGQNVRLSWGRSPQNKQAPQQDANSQFNGNSYYGYQQGYDGYGYSAPNAQDPSMQNYYGYPGYGSYEQQQPPAQQQQQQQPTQEHQQPPPQQQEQQQTPQEHQQPPPQQQPPQQTLSTAEVSTTYALQEHYEIRAWVERVLLQ
ncbi:hypothetical protein ACP4OV_029586 [Aristida adscensionis]